MYWVSAEIAEDTDVATIRQRVLADIPSEEYEQETYPHLTIVPAFTLPNSVDAAVLEEKLADVSFSVTFDAYHVWPSEENPMVVALDPRETDQLRSVQETVLETIDDLDGTIEIDPTAFHMTLFKGGDGDDYKEFSVDSQTVDAVQELESSKQFLPIELTVTSVELLEWEE